MIAPLSPFDIFVERYNSTTHEFEDIDVVKPHQMFSADQMRTEYDTYRVRFKLKHQKQYIFVYIDPETNRVVVRYKEQKALVPYNELKGFLQFFVLMQFQSVLKNIPTQ